LTKLKSVTGKRFRPTDIQNIANVAFVAQIAIYPPKWQAALREKSAKLTFCVGGTLAGCHRNDTNAAKRSRVATAPQGDYSCANCHAAALFAKFSSRR
jgi:hypothetical protein